MKLILFFELCSLFSVLGNSQHELVVPLPVENIIKTFLFKKIGRVRCDIDTARQS